METRIPKFVSKAINARFVSGFSLSKAIECKKSQKWL